MGLSFCADFAVTDAGSGAVIDSERLATGLPSMQAPLDSTRIEYAISWPARGAADPPSRCRRWNTTTQGYDSDPTSPTLRAPGWGVAGSGAVTGRPAHAAAAALPSCQRFTFCSSWCAENAPTLSLPPEAAYADLLNQTCTLGIAAAPLWAEALAAGGDEAKSVVTVWRAPDVVCPGGGVEPIEDAAGALFFLRDTREPDDGMQ